MLAASVPVHVPLRAAAGRGSPLAGVGGVKVLLGGGGVVGFVISGVDGRIGRSVATCGGSCGRRWCGWSCRSAGCCGRCGIFGGGGSGFAFWEFSTKRSVVLSVGAKWGGEGEDHEEEKSVFFHCVILVVSVSGFWVVLGEEERVAR